MSRFKLTLNSDVWNSKRKIHEVLSLERKHQTLEILNFEGHHDELTKVINNFASSLRKLVIADTKIDDFTLREILRRAESLEHLVLSDVSVIRKIPAINPVSLRKLTSLSVHHCDWAILKFINAQVTSFELKSYIDEGSRNETIQFLANQCKLKVLKLRGTSARFIFQQDEIIDSCNFSLESFLIDHEFGKSSDNVNWHLTAFLSLHTTTLKNIEITGPHSEHVTGFAIANLDNLETLAIDVRGLPKNEEFYDFLENDPCKTLKEFSIGGFFAHTESVKKILKKYPAIEKLSLNDWRSGGAGSKILTYVAAIFPNLKDLSITEMTNNENVYFAALKKLSVSYVRYSDKLFKFLERNSSISTFKVGIVYTGQITPSFFDELKSLPHIQHIGFGGNRKALSMILDILKTENSTKSLKTLELSITCADKIVALTATKALKLYFPINKNFEFDSL